MKQYCVIRRSTVINDELKLPRPKIVNKVLLIGGKEECERKLDEEFLKLENRSTEDIQVDFLVQPYKAQKDNTSYRPNNK
jgi:hypothetical protein